LPENLVNLAHPENAELFSIDLTSVFQFGFGARNALGRFIPKIDRDRQITDGPGMRVLFFLCSVIVATATNSTPAPAIFVFPAAVAMTVMAAPVATTVVAMLVLVIIATRGRGHRARLGREGDDAR
jgi:hypothetical protein